MSSSPESKDSGKDLLFTCFLSSNCPSMPISLYVQSVMLKVFAMAINPGMASMKTRAYIIFVLL